MILLSHPTANQNVRQTALALAEAELLEEFWTCVNWKKDGLLDRWLPFPAGVRKELRRRSFPVELAPFLRAFPWREWGRLVSSQLGVTALTKAETGFFSMDAVYLSLDRRVAQRLSSARTIKAVYGYDNGSLESFRVARSRGMKCIYEHPIVYWRKTREYQQEEAELHPEWATTLGSLTDSDEKLARKDMELELADVVIVPSKFSRDSLSHVPNLKARIEVIPYGAPPVTQHPISEFRDNKLRVLFVGALSQAKGLSYALQAVARLERQIEFTLIGQRVSEKIPTQAVLDRYRWIPSLPHDELLREMSRHDVLLFPSLHEGFGLVIAEAMAQGLVVITTSHTAGPDLITDGVDGFVVPIRAVELIAERLERLITGKDVLSQMKRAAQAKAASFRWETYRQQLAAVARALIQ